MVWMDRCKKDVGERKCLIVSIRSSPLLFDAEKRLGKKDSGKEEYDILNTVIHQQFTRMERSKEWPYQSYFFIFVAAQPNKSIYRFGGDSSAFTACQQQRPWRPLSRAAWWA